MSAQALSERVAEREHGGPARVEGGAPPTGRLVAVLLLAAVGCGARVAASDDGLCEPPEIQQPEETVDSSNHCDLLSACVFSPSCGTTQSACADDCVVDVFGDDMCGCCGELECEQACEEVQRILVGVEFSCGAGTAEACPAARERCDAFGDPLR